VPVHVLEILVDAGGREGQVRDDQLVKMSEGTLIERLC
jgi:hypothetical protein